MNRIDVMKMYEIIISDVPYQKNDYFEAHLSDINDEANNEWAVLYLMPLNTRGLMSKIDVFFD
ncbi:hypothetical protein KSI01_11070 [Kurthia sibirica]|nr:hypothetical protein KSI01_11070 [Kurthia sibirica]